MRINCEIFVRLCYVCTVISFVEGKVIITILVANATGFLLISFYLSGFARSSIAK